MSEKLENQTLTPEDVLSDVDESGEASGSNQDVTEVFPGKLNEVLEVARSRKQKFEALLNGLTSLDEKKKYLWLDIYSNAFKEIEMAYKLFDAAVASTDLDVDINHSELGGVMVKYLERASKANDQLLKLVTMIEEEEEKNEELEMDKVRGFNDESSNII